MAIFAIGDIQGCYDELQRLLERIKFDSAQDRLWFSGDLVNRGPKSLESLRFVKGLGERAISVLGNHDLHLLALAAGNDRHKSSDTLEAVLAAADRDELLDWLRRRPLLHHDVTLGFTLVHAGFPPQWNLAVATQCAHELEAVLRGADYAEFFRRMYGNQPTRWSAELRGIERLRFCVNCFTRMRYVNADGDLDLVSKRAPGTQPDGFLPWYAAPGRKSADLHIVFGHWSTVGEVNGHNVYPLDTGCVWGGRLSALRLDGDGSGGWICVDCPGAQQPTAV
ncbi:MAG: symmetrical bis(5'-nucleosyl)-tetraphosphatase [Gammaproteobacteria bacterium]